MSRILPATAILLVCAAPALADIVVKTRDGRTIRVPVDAHDIASIDFNPPGTAAPAGNTRWVDATNASHYFERRGDEWQEYSNGQVAYRHVHKRVTPEFVEMLDTSRNVWVRLYADRDEWSTDTKNWTRSVQGSWK